MIIDLESLRLLRGLVLMLLLGMFVLFAFLAAWWQERKERRQATPAAQADPNPVESAIAAGERRAAELQPALHGERNTTGVAKRAA